MGWITEAVVQARNIGVEGRWLLAGSRSVSVHEPHTSYSTPVICRSENEYYTSNDTARPRIRAPKYTALHHTPLLFRGDMHRSCPTISTQEGTMLLHLHHVAWTAPMPHQHSSSSPSQRAAGEFRNHSGVSLRC
jgi:hypothetical protein